MGGFAFAILSHASAVAAVSLEEAYQAALHRSEDVATQDEKVFQAEEELSQAKGALLPNISASASYLKEAKTNLMPNVYQAATDQRLAKITATQPIFHGGKEYAYWHQQRDLLRASEIGREQLNINTFRDVVQSFYNTLQLEQDLRDLNQEIEVNRKRLAELMRFRQIGRSREAEVLTVQAQIATLESQVELLKGQIRSAREVFVFVSGLDRDVVLVDKEAYPSQLRALPEYVSKIELRPDVRAQMQNSDASDSGITYAQGGHLPILDLVGNYYPVRSTFPDVHWDVGLNLTLPLFQGGIINAQVREAKSKHRQDELALSKIRRQAEEEIKTFYEQITSEFSQIEVTKRAVDLATKTYQADLKDYRLGSVTNLEVLQALTNSQENQRTLDKTQYQLKADYLKLLSAIAERPYTSETTKP